MLNVNYGGKLMICSEAIKHANLQSRGLQAVSPLMWEAWRWHYPQYVVHLAHANLTTQACQRRYLRDLKFIVAIVAIGNSTFSASLEAAHTWVGTESNLQ